MIGSSCRGKSRSMAKGARYCSCRDHCDYMLMQRLSRNVEEVGEEEVERRRTQGPSGRSGPACACVGKWREFFQTCFSDHLSNNYEHEFQSDITCKIRGTGSKR
jgi:hypothetical protein